MLAKTAGVKHLIVLINKMDDPTVNWDEERYINIFWGNGSIYVTINYPSFRYLDTTSVRTKFSPI